MRARGSPGLPPATGAAPHRACAGATCARLDPNRLRPKLLSASSSSPSCGSRPLKECLSQPWSAAILIMTILLHRVIALENFGCLRRLEDVYAAVSMGSG